MKKYVKLFVIISIVIFTTVIPSNAFEATEFLVVHSQYIQYPVVSGNTIAWTEGQTNYYSIHGHDITTHTNSLIHSKTTRLEDPSFGGDIIAWRDYRTDNADVWAYNLTTQSEMPVATGNGSQYYPNVSPDGSMVVWEGVLTGEDYGIYRYDVANQTTHTVTTSAVLHDTFDPQIDGNIVVWRDYRNGNYDIYGYNIDTAQELVIATGTGDQAGHRISGNYIVWGDYRGVMAYDLTTEEEFFVASGASADISGNLIVFLRDSDIYGYDLITEEEFAICTASGVQRDPRISGNHVAWNDYRTHDLDAIYGAIIVPEPISLSFFFITPFFLLTRKK